MIASEVIVLFLLVVPVTQSQGGYSVTYSSTEVCVLRGSTVDINSTYSYPDSVNGHVTTVEKSFWFIKDSDGVFVDLRSDPDYSGRVEYLDGNRKSTLRIKNLRESDSAEYKFRFVTNKDKFTGQPGVTLSVTGLQVKVEKIWVHSSTTTADLICQSSCRLPGPSSYIWHNNQHEVQERRQSINSAYFSSSDTFSCAITKPEGVFSSPLLSGQHKGYSVTYSSTEVCAPTGSTVNITSTYSYPGSVNGNVTTVEKSFWFIKDNGGVFVDLRSDPDYSGLVEYLDGNRKSTLRIKNLKESDSAKYKFRFVTNKDKFKGEPGVTLSVRDPQLQIEVRRSVGQFSTWTQLTCHSSCPLPDHFSYVWSKNGQRVGGKNYLLFDNISPTDSFDCAIEGHERIRSPPVYAPRSLSVSVSPSGQIMEGSSVTLTCSSDAKPAANYTWYKKNTVTSIGQNFTINNITTEHGGEYQCEVQNTVGRQNITKHLVVGGGVSLGVLGSAFIGISTAIFLAAVVVSLISLIKKKTSRGQEVAEPREEPDNTHLPKERLEEEPHYASVHFQKNTRDPVYSNVTDNKSDRNKKQERDEDVTEYSAVKLNHFEPSNRGTVEDPASLYSTVKKRST